MQTNITLYSDQAEAFRDIKGQVEERRGYEPSNAEVVGILMAVYRDRSGDRARSGGLTR